MGKTRPDTLMTIMNTAITFMDGLKDFTKAEEMYSLALDGHEKSKGTRGHEDVCEEIGLLILPNSSFKGESKGTCERVN